MTLQGDLLRALPYSVCIEVTSKCNLRCSYCHKSDEVREALPASNADMTDDMIDDLYRYCKEAGIKHVTLSVGGETTMSAGWHKRVAKFLDDPEIEAHIVSNFARLFSDNDLEALAKFNNLQISFDSSELEMVRKLRSRADLRTIVYNIIRLRQKATEAGRSPRLVVNCVLWRDNIRHIAKLAGFLRELGMDQLMLTEGMISTDHNLKVPDTLDALTDDDVITLVMQINAAEEAVRGSGTEIFLQDHLRARIGELRGQIREGVVPANAAAHFHRRMTSSACAQPWIMPFVTADGNVWPCCQLDRASPVGNLATATMGEILESDAFRAIRASVLEGRPVVPCDDCSFALGRDWPEFIRDIRGRHGDVGPPPDGSETHQQPETHRAAWPGLMGYSEYPVVLENSALRVSEQGTATLSEDQGNGLHRVLFDIESAEFSEAVFLVNPVGRRGLRLDFVEHGEMIGRAHILLTRGPKSEVAIGLLKCSVTAMQDRWYRVNAIFQNRERFSQVNLILMREDNAVIYPGDGRSGLDISGFRITRPMA